MGLLLLLFPQHVGFCRDSNPGTARSIDPAGPKMVNLGYIRKRSPDLSEIVAAQPGPRVLGFSYLAVEKQIILPAQVSQREV